MEKPAKLPGVSSFWVVVRTISKEFLQKRALPHTTKYDPKRRHRGRNMRSIACDADVWDRKMLCIYDTVRVRETITRFYGPPPFFSSSSGSSGVKSISVRIGEKFMRRCRPLVGRVACSILRPLFSVRHTSQLAVFSRGLWAYVHGVGVKASGSRVADRRISHVSIAARFTVVRAVPVPFVRASYMRARRRESLVSIRSSVRSPYPLSLRKSSCALYLASHGATFTGPTLIGSAPRRVMDFCGISRDWNIRVTSGMWNYALRSDASRLKRDVWLFRSTRI